MTGTGPRTAHATAGDAAGGLDAVVVGPLAVDYTISAEPADVHRLLADLVPGAIGSAAPVRQVVDQATIMRVLAALRGPQLYAEPGGRTLRVARHLAGDRGRRVGLVGVAGQTLSPDLAIHAELARHGVDHRHVTADEGLAGITVTVAGPGHTGPGLVYGGANRRLAAALRREQPAVAAYLAGAQLVHAVLPNDPTVVSALNHVLAVARRMNPGLRVSVDTSACREHQAEQVTALVGVFDVLIGAADAGLRRLLDQPPPRIDPGAVVADVRTGRPGLTVLLIAADRVDVWCPDGVVASLTPRAAGAPSLDGDWVASALTAAVLTAVAQGGEVVAAVEAAISDVTAHQLPPPVPAERAVVTSSRAAWRRTVASVLFGQVRRGRVALVVALLGWPLAVVGLVAGWPVPLYAALTIPYLVLRLAPVVFQACSRTRPAAARTGHEHRAQAPLDADQTGSERSGR
jgi:hypothetical protein